MEYPWSIPGRHQEGGEVRQEDREAEPDVEQEDRQEVEREVDRRGSIRREGYHPLLPRHGGRHGVDMRGRQEAETLSTNESTTRASTRRRGGRDDPPFLYHLEAFSGLTT